MTELLETINIGMILEEDVPCPFDHDLDEPPTVKNDLVGVGSKLSSKMSKKSPDGTYLYEKLKADNQLGEADRIPNPRKEGDLKKPNKPVKVRFPGASTSAAGTPQDVEIDYPLSVAAHHCIPAQEALKRCNILLGFMVKKGESAGLKTGKGESDFSAGIVWSNVGYDVNGLQNGIFLPGNYAVGGGRGGLKAWHPQESDDSEGEAEEVAQDADWLTGTPDHPLEQSNTCWQYVKGAIDVGKGQFHDRHEPYSDVVLQLLSAIGQDLLHFEDAAYEGECDKCKERSEHFTSDGAGVPTDYALVTKLNKLSKKLMAYLNASGWHAELYTSRWMHSYMTKILFADSNSPG
ncbi:hypothetical protein NHH03_05125 [Stieleria sp. TO1_6]|uniref:hypothetical protein n=1 Tax=Stieleria tagensis TaxID=2956795 RepID=UPI00209B617A|nr:hypothetical protein [Stieleria tagensis]MCO8121111.1 hypothetical protein [Stieleria tagensis]